MRRSRSTRFRHLTTPGSAPTRSSVLLRAAAGVVVATSVVLPIGASSALASEWVPGPTFPTGGVPRAHVAAIEIGGTIWALGGTPFDGADNGITHYLASGANSWTAAPPQEGPILWHGAAIDALGRIIVVGGVDATGTQEGNNYVYNPDGGPEDGLENRSGDAPLGRFGYATDDVGRVYTVGGGPGPNATAGDPNVGHSERYLAAGDTWEVLDPVPYGVAEAALVDDGLGHLLLFGGIDATASARLTTVAQYDLASESWSTGVIAPMPVALSGHKAVLGSDDRIYVIGGESGAIGSPTPESRVWVLHLPTGTWSEGPSMVAPHRHFGAVMGSGDTIYVLGGDDTDTVETLYTSPCPEFSNFSATQTRWAGETLVLAPTVAGGTPITYRWQKNGIDLSDGPSDGGGTISGAATSILVIRELAAADDGAYTLSATNECGTSVSDPMNVTVDTPADIHVTWTATSLHPNGALSSHAYGVGDGQETGTAVYPGTDGTEDHAMLWSGSAGSAIDLHNTTTIKTGAVATAGGVQGGNWWQPFEIFQNGQWYIVYYPRACAWSGTAGSFHALSTSGWEYSAVYDSDGVHHVGAVSRDDEVGNVYTRAAIWSDATGNFAPLHPTSGVSNSSANALDGDHQYGSILTPYPGPIRKAAKWTGTPASYEDMHPAGASRSWISGAGDGQQVGTAEFNGIQRAVLWSGHRLSAIDLTGTDGVIPSLADARGGLQVGSRFAGGTHAIIMATNPNDWVDLNDALGPEYSTARAEAIDIEEDGTIRIVGWAHNDVLTRDEAMLWTSAAVSDVVLGGNTGDALDQASALQLRLGPNPVSATSTLRLRMAAPGTVEVALFDIAGRRCGGFSWQGGTAGEQTIPLGPAMAELPGGAYFVRTTLEDGTNATLNCRIVR
ncbi:MAG: kelch repeat-containing protein [Candidatus Eisenbacteria bacterium]